MVSQTRGWVGLVAIALFIVALVVPVEATSTEVELLDVLRDLKPTPATIAEAQRAGFDLEGLHSSSENPPLREGDAVTALVEFGSFKKKAVNPQWIVRLQARALPVKSKDMKIKDVTLHTSTGHRFVFGSEKCALQLETLGPINLAPPRETKLTAQRRNIVVAKDFLGLDLSQASRVVFRVMQSPDKGLSITAGGKPFDEAVIKAQRLRAEAMGFTEGDIRRLAGTLPALSQFFGIIRTTPQLQELVVKVLDKPSFIDVIKNGSASSVRFSIVGGGSSDGSEFFWPNTKRDDFSLLLLNLEIYGKPVLAVALYVTAPRPPLLVSAGVVGIVAFSPKNPDKFIGVRVLSTTLGGALPESGPR